MPQTIPAASSKDADRGYAVTLPGIVTGVVYPTFNQIVGTGELSPQSVLNKTGVDFSADNLKERKQPFHRPFSCS
jgi:hypothetical protein